MFTGIVSDIGRIKSITRAGDTRFEIETVYDTSDIAVGASIACSGVCLTVVETGADWFGADVSAETLSCTTAGEWNVGRRINLERPLKAGDELGGHILSGHVDGVGSVRGIRPEGDSLRFEFSAPAGLMRFFAAKGSVAIDGVSLTVNDVGRDSFGVNIIPHTQEATTFGTVETGDPVNLEIDVLARYVARLLAKE